MKLIIAGSRNLRPTDHQISQAINKHIGPLDTVKTVVCGLCKGVDMAGKHWADYRDIHVQTHQAEWSQYGGQAGPKRNYEMALNADALLLIWDGESRGSASMKRIMEKMDKPIYEEVMG